MKFYVYIHIKPNGEIFYVGKGIGNRAYSKKSRSHWWKSVVNKYGYDIFILDNNLTEEESFILENKYIKKIGRRDLKQGTLVNMTDGGEGTSGLIPWNKGKKCIQFSGVNNSQWGLKAELSTCYGRTGTTHPMYNTHHSEESKNQISIKLKERYKNQEHPAKGNTPWNKGMKLKHLSGVNSTSSKKVIDTNTNIIYDSISEAAKIFGLSTATLSRYLSGKLKNKTTIKRI